MTSKYVWPWVIVVSGISVAGSYKAFNHLNRKPISFSQYILKAQNDNGSVGKQVCKRWTKGYQSEIGEEECKKIIQENWKTGTNSGTEKNKEQPELWFESDENSNEEALLDYFQDETLSNQDRKKFSQQIFITKEFTCTRENSSEKSNNRKIRINCFKKGGEKDEFRWVDQAKNSFLY